ncbi:2-dehydro-3-deoxygalactonokinase [Sphingomonas lenta]|uniref:2-oxo-3-deoxygalactonate kinase n=1 Tax=Sphingomonas lenta TaxID=1141887 RepID=A0A2A2SFU3_9SPHN|nr:2-dehydro-3-deoxygalactonokinase [Sphingomonas lenta]PAX08073.1 2-oxo-3-deoxygalactonate kinase [Sphingomonas lenta]
MSDRFIAVDWGTSNRREYLMEGGQVLATSRDDRGIIEMGGTGYEEAVASIRAQHGDLPVLIAGMAGSNRGWREAPYADAPASAADIARQLLWVEPGRTAIVPGVAWRDPDAPSVMRGEEVQLFGAVAAGLVPPTALVAQPGTHNKWVEMRDGAIGRFTTLMTGELFALLKQHSILSAQLTAAITPGPAFLEGVRHAQDRPLPSALFGARAAMLLGFRAGEDTADYVSGLLIGADVGSADVRGREAFILSDETLGALYGAAVAELGGTAHLIDTVAAFTAGMALIRSLSK